MACRPSEAGPAEAAPDGAAPDDAEEAKKEEAKKEEAERALRAEYGRMRERSYARFLRDAFPCERLAEARRGLFNGRWQNEGALAKKTREAANLACRGDCGTCRVARTMYDSRERRFLKLEYMALELGEVYYPSDRLGNFTKRVASSACRGGRVDRAPA